MTNFVWYLIGRIDGDIIQAVTSSGCVWVVVVVVVGDMVSKSVNVVRISFGSSKDSVVVDIMEETSNRIIWMYMNCLHRML